MGFENPQMTTIIANVITFGLLSYWAICILYGALSGKVKPIEFSDRFDIGYIDSPVVVIRDNNPTVGYSAKARTEPARQQPSNTVSFEEAMLWLQENGTK